MGRVKARKPKRVRSSSNGSQIDAVAQAYGQFDPDLLWATLFAAASSPAARHRATSIGASLAASLRSSSISGVRQREPLTDTQALIDLAARSSGIGVAHEDYVPTDPTETATVRVGGDLLRYVPGMVERPIADLSRALRLAAAVDERLVRRHKFGIMNVVRVSLKYVDFCVDVLEGDLRPAPDVELGDAIDVPLVEFHAARKLVSLDPLETLQFDQADLLALEWMTSPAGTATYVHESRTSPFGRTLRYRAADPSLPDRWLPPAYVPEVLAHAVSELVGSLNRDNSARQALRASCVEATRRALWRFSDTLIETPLSESDIIPPLNGNKVHWLVPSGGLSYMAVSLIFTEDIPRNSLRPIGCVELSERVLDRGSSAEHITAEMVGGGSIKLPPGASVVPLVIFSGTSHLMAPQRPGQATLAFEDLTWIAETATSDDDLYRFVLDLSSPRFPTSFGWEAIDYWEPWRANGKTFFKGGISPSHMQFAPHAGESEWERAVARSPLEVALQRVGIPALRDAEMAEISSGGVALVAYLGTESQVDSSRGTHRAPGRAGWSLVPTDPPIAIIRSDPKWLSGQEYRFLFDMCGGLTFAFAAIDETWRRAHQGLDVAGYRLWIQAADDSVNQSGDVVETRGIPEKSEGNTRSALWIFDLRRFVQEADGDPQSANELTVGALEGLLRYGGMRSETVKDIGSEWRRARPFLTLETRSAQTKLNHLTRPWRPHSSDESAAISSFARRLHSAGLQPGEYRGVRANELVKEYLAPLGLRELGERIAMHDVQEVIIAGMEQLNRVVDHLQIEQGNLAQVSRNFTTDWDPVERMAELASESLQLRQCNEIIVEAALRSHGGAGGKHPVTAQRWSGLLAAADAYRTVTTLSERLHHRVAPAIIEISSAYELTFRDDENPTDGGWLLESGALSAAAANIRINPTPDFSDASADGAGGEDPVDVAMLESFDTATPDLFLVLTALARWDSFDEDRSVVLVSEDEALGWVYDAAGDPDEEQRLRLRQAFRMLTVSSDILRSIPWEPWQTRTRRHRLLVEPLVRLPDGSILISPQYLLTTLSVYRNQLTQGVLPWTGEVPKLVSEALATKRAHRNLEFERVLQRQLEELGFATIARVKPGDHKRLGLPELTTEIDLVCGRPGDPNIWLIEAKDPASVYGFAETARQLRTFYRDSESKGRSKPCYATQLSRKEAELGPYVEEIAKKLGVSAPTDVSGHVLQTRFVTRHLVPAGYVAAPPYEVLTATQFFALLNFGISARDRME